MGISLSRRNVIRTGLIVTSGTLCGCTLDNPEVSGNHLFIENRDTGAHTVTISVRETENNSEVVIQNQYRVPGQHVLQFEEVLQSETSYEINVRMTRVDASSQEDDLEVELETCSEEDPAERMDISVVLDSSGPGFVTWPCNETYVYRERLTYVAPEEYVATTETTTVS